MLKGRFNLFMCENCKTEVYVKTFPNKWVYVNSGIMGVEHYCPKCIDKLPEGTKTFKEGER